MSQVIVEPAFFELFPEGGVVVMVVEGVDNHVDERKAPEYQQLVNNAAKAALEHLPLEDFSQNEVIQAWRGAYSQFKTKKGARSSIENLLKRAFQGREFKPIIPLVDLYNSVSLRYAVPLGGEDLDQLAGDLRLAFAQGGESFKPLGEEADLPALPNELCWLDNEGAVCRCLNWREAQRTMLTEATSRVVFISEAVNAAQLERSNAAMTALSTLVQKYLGVTGRIEMITQTQSSVAL